MSARRRRGRSQSSPVYLTAKMQHRAPRQPNFPSWTALSSQWAALTQLSLDFEQPPLYHKSHASYSCAPSNRLNSLCQLPTLHPYSHRSASEHSSHELLHRETTFNPGEAALSGGGSNCHMSCSSPGSPSVNYYPVEESNRLDSMNNSVDSVACHRLIATASVAPEDIITLKIPSQSSSARLSQNKLPSDLQSVVASVRAPSRRSDTEQLHAAAQSALSVTKDKTVRGDHPHFGSQTDIEEIAGGTICPCDRHERKMRAFRGWRDIKELQTQRKNQQHTEKPVPEFREAFPLDEQNYNPITKTKAQRVRRVHQECISTWIPYLARHPTTTDLKKAVSALSALPGRYVKSSQTLPSAAARSGVAPPAISSDPSRSIAPSLAQSQHRTPSVVTALAAVSPEDMVHAVSQQPNFPYMFYQNPNIPGPAIIPTVYPGTGNWDIPYDGPLWQHGPTPTSSHDFTPGMQSALIAQPGADIYGPFGTQGIRHHCSKQPSAPGYPSLPVLGRYAPPQYYRGSRVPQIPAVPAYRSGSPKLPIEHPQPPIEHPQPPIEQKLSPAPKTKSVAAHEVKSKEDKKEKSPEEINLFKENSVDQTKKKKSAPSKKSASILKSSLKSKAEAAEAAAAADSTPHKKVSGLMAPSTLSKTTRKDILDKERSSFLRPKEIEAAGSTEKINNKLDARNSSVDKLRSPKPVGTAVKKQETAKPATSELSSPRPSSKKMLEETAQHLQKESKETAQHLQKESEETAQHLQKESEETAQKSENMQESLEGETPIESSIDPLPDAATLIKQLEESYLLQAQLHQRVLDDKQEHENLLQQQVQHLRQQVSHYAEHLQGQPLEDDVYSDMSPRIEIQLPSDETTEALDQDPFISISKQDRSSPEVTLWQNQQPDIVAVTPRLVPLACGDVPVFRRTLSPQWRRT